MFEIFNEECPECEKDTEYTIHDIGEDNHIECSGCHKRVAPCSLCIFHSSEGCGTCASNLVPAINKARATLRIFELHPSVPSSG